MSAYVLPAAVYSSPPRPGRDGPLNTIMEESESESTIGGRSESGTESDGTIVGRPAAWNPKLFVAGAKSSRLGEAIYTAASPASDASSPASAGSGSYRRRSTNSVRSVSDDGTVFSDTCPSLGNSSDTTSFATDSTRNSVTSTSKAPRNRYPGLVIPRPESWASNLSSPLGKSPLYKGSPILTQLSALSAARVPLTPALLSALPKHIPLLTATPSLGDGSSVASETPSLTAVSAPPTPDMHILQPDEGESWGHHERTEPEMQMDSMSYSYDDIMPPPDMFSEHLDRISRDWSDIVVNFPNIPGATPEARTPITPSISRKMDFPKEHVARTEEDLSEAGVELPADALRTLETLFGNGRDSPTSQTPSSDATEKEEMKEIAVFASRRHSMDEETPISETSDYSFSELSIPSPGGFFASLKSNSRHTWCLESGKKISAPPSSATAENFYNAPWNATTASARQSTVETVLEIHESTLPTMSAPPTARQADFGSNVHRRSNSQAIDDLDDDMYGPAVSTNKPGEIRYEYEEAYEDEIKHAAEANIDRTGGWLSAQTTYMSALRETNPVNDVSSTANPLAAHRKSASLDSPMKTAVAFMDTANQAHLTSPDLNTSPKSPKDPLLHNAFTHLTSKRRRRDAFLHGTPRASFIQSLRIAEPKTHLNNLLGTYKLTSPDRPKYSGPFSQNPRATGVFSLTPAQSAFKQLEREQAAIDLISPSSWSVDALRYLYGGRPFASKEASDRLKSRATVSLDDPSCTGKKRHRVLDLGGEVVGGWAWTVARENPNVKVYSVVQKSQIAAGMSVNGIGGPANHRVVSVPRLWALPFRDGFFDVVSARSLHVLLKSEPVPGRREIDEFDLTLREVMRVLKAGGTVEWMVMDSALKGAGPLGEKMSVEFGFALKGRGYEREVTRGWLARMRKAGFTGVKRAWVCLPVGVGMGREADDRGDEKKQFRDAPRPISEVSDVGRIVDRYLEMEAVHGPVGSSRDVADLSGLLGASMWESWIVKLGMEMGRERGKLLEGVPGVLEEGAITGAGWRVLSGWARKPYDESRRNTARTARNTQSEMSRVERDQMGTIRIKADI
jgi:hypothetical protein